MAINKVTVSGNLTRDAELRVTSSGTQILNFTVAHNDRRRTANGEWHDQAHFFQCVMFGKRAEALAQYLSKGIKVVVQGKLNYRSWEDKNGNRRSDINIIVDELEFMSNRREQRDTAVENQPSDAQSVITDAFPDAQVEQLPSAPNPAAYSDEDIPF